MNFQNIAMLQVFCMRGSEKVPVGRLAQKDKKIYFEYDSDFLKTGLELSPFKLPLQAGVHTSPDLLFDGLFGLFNDCLPDGWGRLLLDRKLMSLGVNPGQLSPLDRLRYVGHGGMGALVYEPVVEEIHGNPSQNLDDIADEAIAFIENDDDRFIDDLLIMNGSSAGARPKVVINMEGEDWLIKFPSSIDPKDIGPIEYAYHLMAKASGLEVPEAKLFPARERPGYFGVKRFDRIQGKLVHMHSLSGLLHTDHRIPSLDYQTVMKATAWLTKDAREVEKQYRASLFNILSHNRDDHAKNFSFLMDEKGEWRVSPAYDLTFSSGPNGEHCSMVMGEGKNPNLEHLLKLADLSGIKEKTALQVIDEVKSVVSNWHEYASRAGVGTTSLDMVRNILGSVAKNF